LNAYVLIQTDGEGGPIAGRLEAIPGVLSADDISGAYDAIALAQARSTRHLIEDVISEIRRVPSVTRALPAPLIGSLAGSPQEERPVRDSPSRDEAA